MNHRVATAESGFEDRSGELQEDLRMPVADREMYRAKRSGKNMTCSPEEVMVG